MDYSSTWVADSHSVKPDPAGDEKPEKVKTSEKVDGLVTPNNVVGTGYAVNSLDKTKIENASHGNGNRT